MRSVEVEGDSIDDAIRKALIELGVSRDRAAIEIINDARRGILGFGGQKARVKATVRAPLATSLADIGERSSRVSRETPPASPAEGRREFSRKTPIPASSAPKPVSRETRAEGTPDRGSRGRAEGLAPNVRTAPTAAAVVPAPSTSLPTGDLATRAREVLVELLSQIGVRCDVAIEPGTDGAVMNLAVQGESSALLIGKHGQTLDAIEYLLNRIVIRESGSTSRIEVDVEGYRARRVQTLIANARRMADKVRQTGKPATVDLMNPRDRRIVHMALKDEIGVTSRSQGDGFLRKLIILPAGRRRSGPSQSREGE